MIYFVFRFIAPIFVKTNNLTELMANQESSYRQIFKATGVFGGMQVFKILINIIKSKVIAILLGPAGIGLYGVLNSTLDVLKSVTDLGLGVSAVKEVSEAAASNDIKQISSILKTLQRWVYFTGSIGFLLTLLFAPYLSQWTFGNDTYTWAFRWLSIVLLFSALSSGQTAALQGMRQIVFLAKAGMIGSFAGLCMSLPLFFWFGYTGVVLTILISAVCTFVFTTIYARKIPTIKVEQSCRETVKQGLSMAKLGLAMMFNAMLTLLAAYILKAYIARHGGIDDAGIYQSAFAIAEGYFGLIFTAMAADYYPRLAAINKDRQKLTSEVNKQAEIGLLIAFPCIIIALFFMPIGIRLLYSNQFLSSVECINWAMLGNIFKIGSWTMGYVLIAKGKSKLFAISGIGFNAIYLTMMILGYRNMGIEGVGIAFFGYYVIHFIGISLICALLFKINYKREFFLITAIVLFVAIAAFLLQNISHLFIKYTIAAAMCALSLYISYKLLDKRMGIKEFIANKLHKS